MKLLAVFFLIFSLLAGLAFAGSKHHELYYSKRWCTEHQGIPEYVLSDGTRVDCLTSSLAVEFDWASKWAESIGQALFYAAVTGKVPAVALIIKKPKDYHYVARVYRLISEFNLPIQVIIIDTKEVSR